jgi:hypothetical protein
MIDPERILTAYEKGLNQLHEELAARLGLGREEQEHLKLINELLLSIVRTYGSFYISRKTMLDASTSVMYATSVGPAGEQVLNVSLASLVENSTLTAWQARFITSCLGTRRTLFVAGEEGVGKSTLLNALLQLLPVDQRMVAIEEAERLPALKNRSFTVRLTSEPASPARLTALRKAMEMQPNWLVVDDLAPADGPAFLEALGSPVAGLASMDTSDLESTLRDWVARQASVAEGLTSIQPVIAYLGYDRAGSPRVLDIYEVLADPDGVRVQPRRPGE